MSFFSIFSSTITTDVKMLQVHEIILAIIPTLINLGATPLMDVIALNTYVAFVFVYVALASEKQHVYHVCIMHSVAMTTRLMLGPAGIMLPSNS